MTPSELTAVPTVAKQVGVYAMATLDLAAYADMDAVMKAARLISTKRGTVNRQIARARRSGYTVREFEPGEYLPDMVAIHRSKTFRDRKPMEGALHLADADALAKMIRPVAARACAQHNESFWGVFREATDRSDGDYLVGYICLTRLGNSAVYRHLMGRGDHLRNGIMYLLHYELVATLLKAPPAGLRYLTHGAYARRPLDPPTHWKRLALFKPHYLLYADDHSTRIPVTPSMPGLAEGLLAVKQTLDEPWPQAVTTAAQIGVSQEWLGILHRMWIVENVRAPGLMMNVLRSGPYPPLDVLRPLGSNLFPAEALDGIESTLALLRNNGRGLDTLLPVRDSGMERVHIIHTHTAELNALEDTYPATWTYGTRADTPDIYDADLWIGESDQPESLTHILKSWASKPSRRMLMSVSETDFLALDCPTRTTEEITTRFSEIIGHTLTCRSVHFRHGAPEEMHWVWLEKAG